MIKSLPNLKVLRKWISLALVLIFLAWGVFYLVRHPDSLKVLENISISSLLILISLGLIKLLVMGMFTWVNLDALGIRLRFWEMYGLSAMTTMGNYLIAFRGGAVIRGVYLKATYNFPYSLFLSTVASLYLITFPTNAVLGLVALVGIRVGLGIQQTAMFLFLLLCLVGPVIFLIVIRRAPAFSGRWLSKFNPVIDGWKVLTERPGTIIKLILASILNSLVTILLIHYSFLALGIDLPLFQSSVFGVLYLISAMVPITPAGMGFAEAMLVLVSGAFGISSSINILAAGLNRSIMIVVSLLLGPLFTMILSRHSGKPIRVFQTRGLNKENDE